MYDLTCLEIEGIKLSLECLGKRLESLLGFAAFSGASNPDSFMLTELLEDAVCHGFRDSAFDPNSSSDDAVFLISLQKVKWDEMVERPRE